MRWFAVLAALVFGGSMAFATVQQPEPWECAAVARIDVDNLEQEIAFAELNEMLGYPPPGGASLAELRQRKRQAEERAARWPVTTQQIEDLLNTPAEDVDAIRVHCASREASAATPPARSTAANPPVISRPSFVPEPATDRWGNDIGMVEVAAHDFDACRRQCEADSRCAAFTLYTPPPFAAGFCWLKHSPGSPAPAEFSTSAVR